MTKLGPFFRHNCSFCLFMLLTFAVASLMILFIFIYNYSSQSVSRLTSEAEVMTYVTQHCH